MAVMKRAIPVLATLLAAACAAPSPPAAEAKLPMDVDPLVAVRAQRYLELLATYLPGRWDTVEQPANQGDSTPMRVRYVKIWPERAGERWFYEEYVDRGDDQKVLRQRIFRLVREDTNIRAVMYRLPGNAAAYVGEWRKTRPFAGLSPANLQEARGCSVVWQPQLETYFAGGTPDPACRGENPQAASEHAEYYLGSTSMRAWIFEVDPSGKRVAGLTGPSEFRKISEKLT